MISAAVPTRIKVFEYGESWEGRKLIYAAVGSETNIRRLGEIKSGIHFRRGVVNMDDRLVVRRIP